MIVEHRGPTVALKPPRPQPGFFIWRNGMTTTTCRECGERFPLNRRSNQYGRASGILHKGTRFCSAACKQLAYRKRNANHLKSVPGTVAHATVTRSPQVIENI